MGPAKGGVDKLQIFVVKNTLNFSNNLWPKRSLNARLAHSKSLTRSSGRPGGKRTARAQWPKAPGSSDGGPSSGAPTKESIGNDSWPLVEGFCAFRPQTWILGKKIIPIGDLQTCEIGGLFCVVRIFMCRSKTKDRPKIMISSTASVFLMDLRVL